MAKLILTDEERMYVKAVVLELREIRKILDGLSEAVVKLNDKEFLKAMNSTEEVDLKESQVDRYEEKLQKQLYTAKKEFQP